MMRQPDVRRGIPLALCAGTLLPLVLFRTPVTWIVVAALVLTAAAILVVGRDDERRSLAWETAER
jgi:hypothetical protein